MTRRVGLVALLLLLATAPVLAQEGGLVGKEALEIQANDWINRPEKTSVADHRGEVLLMEFFATW